MNINEKIFTVLKEKKISQKELSRLSGISESTISDWKRKGKTPGLDKILVVSKVLGISLTDLVDEDVDDTASMNHYELNLDEKLIIDIYRKADAGQKKRLIDYFEKLNEAQPQLDNRVQSIADKEIEYEVDDTFLNQKLLARRLRKLARLDRITIDESEHASQLNLHLFKYLDFIGMDKLEYVKQYLCNIQPFMISEIRSQEKFDNAICVLDEFYRISVYIKVNATRGEEIVVSFHENHKYGIARRNTINRNLSYVYVFADSIGSHVVGSDSYSINIFITRGVSTIPINVPASKYDEDGFMVRYSYINNAIIDIANRYLEDLYSSDIDFSKVELFSSLQQLSFTSYGNDIFSNISLLIDSLIIQVDSFGKQIADSALCIYCGSLDMLESDKKEVITTLKERYKVNSVRALPQIIERVEMNL